MIKKLIFFAVCAVASRAYSMEFCLARANDKNVSGPVVIGTSLIAMGIWRGAEEFFKWNSGIGTVREKDEHKKLFHYSIAAVSTGISILWNVSRDQQFSYVNSMIR